MKADINIMTHMRTYNQNKVFWEENQMKVFMKIFRPYSPREWASCQYLIFRDFDCIVFTTLDNFIYTTKDDMFKVSLNCSWLNLLSIAEYLIPPPL